MGTSNPIRLGEPILDTMIELALAVRSQRIIVTGSAAFDIYRGLCRRGFSRVATTATCRLPHAQHDVALVAGQHSVQGLETQLIRVVPFIRAQGTIAVWIDSVGIQRGKKIQLLLERLGFHIESGAKCESGFVLAARRRNWSDLASAA